MDKEYIERGDAFDAVMGQYCACSDETEEALNGAIEDIRKIPAADVVEVVRCKDCVYHYYAVDGAGMCELGIGSALLDNDFCSRGIRKDGAKMEVQDG